MCKPVRIARECTEEIIQGKDIDTMLGNSLDEEQEPLICPKCGKALIEKNGKFGKFLGCTGFPSRKFTKSVFHKWFITSHQAEELCTK